MRNVMRSEREKLRYSQREIAEKVGCSRDHVTNIELGNKTPGFELAVKIYDTMISLGMSKTIGMKEFFKNKK